MFAQSGSEPVTDDSTVTYPSSYFSQFAPVSVRDMLDRIPGIDLALGNQNDARVERFLGGTRGLGGSSQILIDGKRLAGKENEARNQLSRIAAAEVQYIEIVRGTSSELDVQNSGQLINIVLREAQTRSSLSAEVGVRRFQDSSIKPEGTFSMTGQRGALSYQISANTSPGYRIEDTFELSLNPDLSFNETVELERIIERTNYNFNSNLTYEPSSENRFALNLLYSEQDPPTKLLRTFTDFSTGLGSISFEREDNPSKANNWEIGGDYEHIFGNGAKYKFLFIVNDRKQDTTRERFEFLSPGDFEFKNLFIDNGSRYREKILRTSYTQNVTPAQGLELGLEVAQTTQDSSLRLGLPLVGEGSLGFGGLVPVDLPNAFASVEEIRYEAFAIHNWRIAARMSLESSLIAEYSRIEQTGDVDNARHFDFLKPKVDFRYDINNSFQMHLTAEKFVSQLRFADFSAATNLMDEDQDTIAGNPELVQEESWRYNVNLDYRLPNDGGVVNLRLFYLDVENHIGRIDISPSPTQLKSTNGNVGDGSVSGLNLNTSIRLGMVGLPSALLTAGFLVQNSRIDDALIGKMRKVVPYDRGSFNFGFRHDMSGSGINYGFNYRSGIDGNRPLYDIDNVLFMGSPSNLTVFAEKQGFAGLTYRFEAINVFNYKQKQERRRFSGYLRDDVLKEIERFSTTDGVRLTFKVRGTF